MLTLYHHMPVDELPTASNLARDDVEYLLNPIAKEVPELRPNVWLEQETSRLESVIAGDDSLAAVIARSELSMRLANNNPTGSLEHAEEALLTAEELRDERAVAKAKCALGWAIFNSDPTVSTVWREASERGLDAEYSLHDLGEPIWEAHAMVLRLQIAGPTGTLSAASGLEGSIFELLREPSDVEEYLRFLGLSRLSLVLAHVAHHRTSTADLARRYLAVTVAYARAAPEPLHIAEVHLVLGGIAGTNSAHAAARSHFSRADRIAARQGSQAYRLRSLVNQAESYLDENNIATAREIMAAVRQLDQKDVKGWTERRLEGYLDFKIAKAEGRWDDAEQHLLGLGKFETMHRYAVLETCSELIKVYKAKGTLCEHLDVYDRIVREQNSAMEDLAVMRFDAAELQRDARQRSQQRKLQDTLRSMLPASVYKEITKSGESEPRYYPDAVLFYSDFAGFTKIASALTPRQLIEELSDLFENFDRIMAANDCERIEIIGDAYIAAAGLSAERGAGVAPGATAIARAALQIQEYLSERNSRSETLGGSRFVARIGLHAGPIIGGMVGRQIARYAIFGDAVITAQRLEAACEPGRILVSETVQRALNGEGDLTEFELTPLGEITPKNKGPLPVWDLSSH